MRWLAELRVLLLTVALATAGAQAADVSPQPFTATYAATLNGMPLGVDVTLSLASAGNDEWDMALSAGSLMMHYRESSRFHWQGCVAEPRRYRFEFRGFGVDRKLFLDFDPAARSARGEARRGPVSFAVPAGATDELALTWSARCRLVQGAEQVNLDVATTSGMKQYTYRVDGRETLKTPYATLDTVRISRVRKAGDKRRDTLWVAPSLGYIMVKMEHVEKIGVRGMIVLKQLQGITPVRP